MKADLLGPWWSLHQIPKWYLDMWLIPSYLDGDGSVQTSSYRHLVLDLILIAVQLADHQGWLDEMQTTSNTALPTQLTFQSSECLGRGRIRPWSLNLTQIRPHKPIGHNFCLPSIIEGVLLLG